MNVAVQSPPARIAPSLDVWGRSARSFAPGAVIVRADGLAEHVHLVQDGWALRSRLLPDGRRQILDVLMAGDVFALDVRPGERIASGLTAASRCTVASAARGEVLAALEDGSDLALALRRSALRQNARIEERVATLGRRSATERVSHFLCELLFRTGGESCEHCDLPLTQTDIADAMGLSVVHVNRVLQTLRRSGLIELSRGALRCADLAGLRRLGLFDSVHLR